MQMKERTFAAQEYTYGFNGQEQDTELYEGSYTAEFWQYDSRLGKRWNKDPVVDPSESSYATNKNNPIKNSDPNGDCSTCPKPSGSFSLKLSYTFGGDRKTSNFNFGVAGNLSANGSIGNALVQGSLNASYMVTNGGITQPFGERNKIRSELIVSHVINIGVGSGAPVSVNYLHNNATTSLSNPIKYSATYSLNNHFTSDGRGQTTATYGVRVGKVSLNVLEDIGYWLGADGKDRYWTGSGNLNFQANNGDVFTLGTDTYTGESINESSDKLDGGFGDTEIGGVITSPGKHKGENFYWANQGQLDGNTGFYQSLNNAQTFLQMNTAYGLDVRMTTTGPMNFWSQNLIHDNLPQPFHHFKPARSKNEFEVTISGGL
jgi:RHS repeat-associated protein